MAISLGSNLALHTRLPLDDRTLFENIQELKDYPENFLADVCYAFVKEDNGSMYIFNRENESTDSTGKWRKFTSSGGTADVPIEKIKVNGELQIPVNKVVDITVPEITNDLTNELKEAYDKAVEDSHTHTNKSIIDKFSESADGVLLYDDQYIEADLSDVYKKTETYSQTEADDKFVAKESGKGLSANDLTDELKTAYDEAVTAKHTHENGSVLDSITTEKVEAWDKAEENVQADWNETDDTADGFIKNKPTIPDEYDDSALSQRVTDIEADYLKADDISNLVEKEEGKTLISTDDILQITKNKDDITTLNGTGEGSVDKKIADKLSEQTYLTKEIATADKVSAYIADPTTAKFNVIYLVKDETVTGSDKYFEYQRIGNEDSSTFEMTGDTSTNLADYAKKSDLHSHDNKDTLDKLSESNEGALLFNGEKIESELVLDSTPTKDSENYVNSGTVYGALFETKQRTVIDTPENYVVCTSSDDGALEVVADDAVPTATQVTLSVVQAFVPTAQVGEYYQHIDEVSHLEDYESSIYAPRDEVYDKTDIDEKVQDINDAINSIISGGYEPMSVAEFTNFYDGLVITATQI